MTSAHASVGRNDPCPCGSGNKFKQCCLGKTPEVPVEKQVVPLVLGALGIVAGIGVAVVHDGAAGAAVAAALLLLAGGVYLFMNVPPPDSNRGDPGGINFGRGKVGFVPASGVAARSV